MLIWEQVLMTPPSIKCGAIGLILPADFNTAAHNSVSERLSKYLRTHPTEWKHFSAAWNAIAFRFDSFAAADNEYRALMSSESETAERNCRIQQTLFDFFCRGSSAIESFFHAASCLGSIVAPTKFPLNVPRDLRSGPLEVASAYEKVFGGERIAKTMDSCLKDAAWTEVSDYRIVLFHRGAPPRNIILSPGAPTNPPSATPSNLKELASDWRFDQDLDAKFSMKYRHWIGDMLSRLLGDAEGFCQKHL